MRGRFRAIGFEQKRADARPRRGSGRAAAPLLLSAGLLLGITACGGGAPTATVAPTLSPTSTVPVVATVSRATATDTRAATPVASATRGIVNYPPVVQLVIEALARDAGVPQGQIVVTQVEAQDWPSSALGCPEPGRAYLQVITPGYRVILTAQGKNYEYHTNQTSMVVRCP